MSVVKVPNNEMNSNSSHAITFIFKLIPLGKLRTFLLPQQQLVFFFKDNIGIKLPTMANMPLNKETKQLIFEPNVYCQIFLSWKPKKQTKNGSFGRKNSFSQPWIRGRISHLLCQLVKLEFRPLILSQLFSFFERKSRFIFNPRSLGEIWTLFSFLFPISARQSASTQKKLEDR